MSVRRGSLPVLLAIALTGLDTGPAAAAVTRTTTFQGTRTRTISIHGYRTRTVSFHGYRISVPASWPVYYLARNPRTCVRFDRHAVYVGAPSPRQRCPAHVVGRTEAILLAPLTAVAAGLAGSAPGVGVMSRQAPRLPGGAADAQVAALPAGGNASAYVLPRAGIQVVATWQRQRSLLTRILHHPLTATPAGRPARPAPLLRAAGAEAQAVQTAYSGPGFDTCSAPSTSAMSAWSASPYRAVGIYIGGPNEGCSQPNLNAAWVSAETAAGWQVVPTYVGLQGGGSGCGCSEISPARASAQGAADASAAVADAQALGIPAGNAIYDDMEQYTRNAANSAAVLAYLQGWTDQLHAEGYLSGVYSSASSGVADLVGAVGTGYTEPDDIWIADWDGQQTSSDPYVPSSDWAGSQRMRQYAGGHDETWGGVRINIDSDYLGGAAGAIADGSFVQVAGTTATYRIAGGSALPIGDLSLFGSPPPAVQQITAAQLEALRPYPADGTIVAGLPSGTYWSFVGGRRTPAAPQASAVQVPDAALTAFAVIECVAPHLKHMSLPRARAALAARHCALGHVRRPRHWPRGHRLRVFGQSVAPQSIHPVGYRISLRLI